MTWPRADAGAVRLESEKIYSGKLCIDCYYRMRANPALLVNDNYQAIGEGDCTLCKAHSKVRIPLKWMVRGRR